MLGKLMKYELRATSRTMLPLFLLTLLLSVFTRMSTAVVQHTHTNITESLNMLLIFAFVLALIGTAVFSVILMVMRFRNNLMTDEGYLMFTLPVSVHQLLWAKLLVSMLWFVAVFCVDALAILLAIYENGMFAGLPEFVRNVFDSMNRYYAVNGLLYMLELLGVLIVSMVTACLLFYAPISIGNSFATHKTLLSVVFYFVIQAILQIFGVAVLSGVVSDTAFHRLLTDAMDNLGRIDSQATAIQAAHGTMLLALFTELFLGAILYFLTYFMLRKHRNLQ